MALHIDNYVPNHGFEQHGISTHFGSKLYNLDDWKVNGGTPDSHRPSITVITAYNPKQGDSYAGVFVASEDNFTADENGDLEPGFDREYLSVKLKNTLVQGTEYNLSFSYRLAQTPGLDLVNNYHGVSDFGMVLSSSQFPIAENVAEVSQLIEAEPQLKVEKIITNQSNWETISIKYIAKGSERFLTLGCFTADPIFLLIGDGYDDENGEKAYVQVDDVRVSPIPICDHPCPPELGLISYTEPVADACLINIYPWHAKVSNVIEYELYIKDDYSTNHYESRGFNPNGFINYDIFWNGNKSNGGVFPNGVYLYDLYLRSCRGSKHLSGTVNTQLGNQEPIWVPNDLYGVEYYPSCCKQSITYNNEELPEVSLSYTYIKATNCQVPSSESVEFYGESITLKTGFRAYPGSNFIASTDVPCSVNPGARLTSPIDITLDYEQVENVESLLEVFPNPTHNNVTIRGSEMGEYLLYNSFGQEVLKGNKQTTSQDVDMSPLANGLYLLRINGETHQLIKQ